MIKKKKYPKIEPKFSEDKKKVYLDIDVYNSIFEELKELEATIKNFNKKTAPKKK